MNITINNNVYTYPKGTSLLDISHDFQHQCHYDILCGLVNNKIVALSEPITKDSHIDFLDITHAIGCDVMIRSLSYIFVKACYETLPNCQVSIRHSLHKGLYCELSTEVTKRDIDHLRQYIDELVKYELPIVPMELPLKDAISLLDHQPIKQDLLRYLHKKQITVYECSGYIDHFYGTLVPNTKYLKVYDIEKINGKNAVMLFGPNMQKPDVPIEFLPSNKLIEQYEARRRFGETMGLSYLNELNHAIREGKADDIIRTMEAAHENDIVKIANQIATEHKRIICIAGPSSSGKTSFAKRLELQLKANGLSPITISTDNYFVNRVDTPLDEHGQKNYETIHSIDLTTFNKDMLDLIKGNRIDLPYYNFISGQREYRNRYVQINGNQPIIIEGIHGLNPLLTKDISDTLKFKVYISPLTSLGLDTHNRIKTTDTRLIRRMVRDSHSRGHSATDTLRMWASVRKGEHIYIFPFQEEADVMYNSAYDYELAVLRKYALPLLQEVKADTPQYAEARRLINLLGYFEDITDETAIYNTSLLKEFLGGSVLVD